MLDRPVLIIHHHVLRSGLVCVFKDKIRVVGPRIGFKSVSCSNHPGQEGVSIPGSVCIWSCVWCPRSRVCKDPSSQSNICHINCTCYMPVIYLHVPSNRSDPYTMTLLNPSDWTHWYQTLFDRIYNLSRSADDLFWTLQYISHLDQQLTYFGPFSTFLT